MHTGQMLMKLEGSWGMLFPESNFLTYGLGWFLSDYKGLKLVSHGGNIDGMTAFVAFVPEREYGIVILANLDSSNAFITALTHRLIDRFEGGEQIAWSDTMLERWTEMQAQGRKQAAEREKSRVAGTAPTLPIAEYVGTYHNAMYGNIEVVGSGAGLVARYGAHYEGPLEHWHFDTFRAVWDDPSGDKEFFRFEVGNDGKVAVLHAQIEGSIEFKRVEDEDDGQ